MSLFPRLASGFRRLSACQVPPDRLIEILQPCFVRGDKLSWKDTYQGMALEHEDWNDLDMAVADGLD